MSETSIPFPALTPDQRLHIEIYGYVIIENMLTSDQVNLFKDTIYGIEDDFRPMCHFGDTIEIPDKK